ncbi:MAG TPA: TadE family protein [Pyrinomonadaceae bacterium]|jgi:Flp pilus assembly protein TadG|nr:TadE family protein [Pyrinomonadaceae bacterium]
MTLGAFHKHQRGTSIAEFAIVALVFFMIIFGIIEFGRFLYTHNALTDATRRGARYGVLHLQNINCVKNVTVYGESHINPSTCAPLGPALINGLTPDQVTVQYAGASTNPFGMNVGTVTVSIPTYSFRFNIPVFSRTVTLGGYKATLTAESAGVIPPDI